MCIPTDLNLTGGKPFLADDEGATEAKCEIHAQWRPPAFIIYKGATQNAELPCALRLSDTDEFARLT